MFGHWFVEADPVSLLTAADADMPDWRRTRAERIAELREQIKDISHNGEEKE